MFAVVAGRFSRAESRSRARDYLQALLSEVERKNSWQLAEHAGLARPDGMQRLLNSYQWDADLARDDLRGYVVDQVGDPAAVLVADETGFLKKGTHSAGVARQYSGTAGRVENSQVAVFCAYVTPSGTRALIDRELYLPVAWTQDRVRARAAGIDDEVAFATKPEMARRMIARALDARVPFGWFAADELYGQNPALRTWLEQQQVGYVLAVPKSTLVTTPGGRLRVDALPPLGLAFEQRRCGMGSKGPRIYDWALIGTTDPRIQVMIRRSIADDELAFYLCHNPRRATFTELIRVAGARWGIEECFQAAKNETGLDHYQVRTYQAWYRHITLAMLAHAYLAITAAVEHTDGPEPDLNATEIPLSVNEIRHLQARTDHTPPTQRHCLRWSHWRRRHQATARRCHYQRRTMINNELRL
jgi:SRSO17 transposase